MSQYEDFPSVAAVSIQALLWIFMVAVCTNLDYACADESCLDFYALDATDYAGGTLMLE